MRDGSRTTCELSSASANPKADTRMNKAAPTPTSAWVRRPAARSRRSRSAPTIAPRTVASTRRPMISSEVTTAHHDSKLIPGSMSRTAAFGASTEAVEPIRSPMCNSPRAVSLVDSAEAPRGIYAALGTRRTPVGCRSATAPWSTFPWLQIEVASGLGLVRHADNAEVTVLFARERPLDRLAHGEPKEGTPHWCEH